MFETVTVTTSGAVGRLTLNRPGQLNALSTQVLRDLTAAAQWFDEQQDVRVVIVGGEGRVFCAGADLSGFPTPEDPGLRRAAEAGLAMAAAVENMQALTIAQLHGWCIGGGLVLATACDLRIASQGTRFSIPEVDLGVPLGWGGIERLVREIGPARTKELVITCRAFDAQEAQGWGLVNRVVAPADLDQQVEELAQSIAEKPRIPVTATKQNTNAVTAQMVSLGRVRSDADSIFVAFNDPECCAAREAYIAAKQQK